MGKIPKTNEATSSRPLFGVIELPVDMLTHLTFH